jgi:hypothetical protein
MEGKLEQSQSILGEQREGDKPTAIMKKQQQMRPWRHLFHLPSRITPKGGSKYGLIIMLRDLPETHMYKQAVVRLCQGATDKEAGSYASNIRPKNIEEAIDQMRIPFPDSAQSGGHNIHLPSHPGTSITGPYIPLPSTH